MIHGRRTTEATIRGALPPARGWKGIMECTELSGFHGAAHQNHGNTSALWAPVHSALLTPLSHKGTAVIYISGVTGGSQELTVLEAKISLTGRDWQKHSIETGAGALWILGIDFLRRVCFMEPNGYWWAFGTAAVDRRC